VALAGLCEIAPIANAHEVTEELGVHPLRCPCGGRAPAGLAVV